MSEPSEQRCATCAWWDHLALDDHYGPPSPFLRDEEGRLVFADDVSYQPTPAPGRWGWCKKVAEFGPGTSDKFYVVDGSEYVASLSCREDFGCVEWEAE